MDVQDVFPIRFLKPLVACHRLPDRVALPSCFLARFRDFIAENVIVVPTDGVEILLRFERTDGMLVGCNEIYRKFGCVSHVVLTFEYNDGNIFRVKVMDSETQVEFQSDNSPDIGFSFFKLMLTPSSHWKKLTAPTKFRLKYFGKLPEAVLFQLRNGTVVEGSFDEDSGTFTGLQNVLKCTSLKQFKMLVLSYFGNGLFKVHAFGPSCMEKHLISENLGNALDFFEIEVKPSHLQDYSFGVMVPSQFNELTNKWDEVDVIRVRDKDSYWEFTIKKRNYRTELHHPWPRFWKQMNLLPQDICVFKRSSSNHDFGLQVYRQSV